MMNGRYYRGFSTRDYEEHGGYFEKSDVDLVTEDLMNEIFTVKGERLKMPTFGTRIPLLVFEPNDAQTYDVIREDITSVCERDPRVEIVNLDVIPHPDKNALIAILKLNYKEFNVVKDLMIEINSR